jgi:hypothetical protein
VIVLGAKNWTVEETEYLMEQWGTVATKSISKKLNRSMNAVRVRAVRLNLGDPIISSKYLTINHIAEAFGKEYSSIDKCWVAVHGMPIKLKIFCKKMKVKVIEPIHFWKWAQKTKGLINFSKYERYSLPGEPSWVAELVRSGYDVKTKSRTSEAWTKTEDDQLKFMMASGKYMMCEMAEKLGRTEGAIKRRAADKGLHKNFIKIKKRKWTDEEVKSLIALAKQGYTILAIGKKLGRTEMAVRGRLERLGYNPKTCTFKQLEVEIK